MKVIKRNGKIVDFDNDRIVNAIENAMRETVNGVDNEISQLIAKQISSQNIDVIQIEQIQDMVEEYLMNTNRKDVAKRYILYRNNRNKTRNTNKNIGLLSEEFLSKYKHKPSPMNQLGNFVYYRTYSRWLPEEQRREYWWETVKRSVEYNCSLIPTSREEAEKLYDNIYNLRQFLSGRTLYIGGTLVSEKFPTSNYNCSFSVVDNFEVFKDAFYLLMIGSGFGFRILKSDVSKLPRVKSNIEILHKEYTSTSKNKREDNTSIQFVNNNMIKITVGDSKGGWVQALDYYLKILWDKDFTDIETIIFIYDHVRPKGERLKTFGGTASGYESLKSMFTKVSKIIKNEGINQNKERIKLKPINCLDILNAIGENVVIGGVRRTSEIALINSDDEECIKAKNNLYKQTINGKWEIDTEMTHRQMSNNSIYYKEKPSREQIHWQIEQMRYSGEPAFVNEIAGNKRRLNFNGVNPCFTGDMKLLTVNGYKTFEELDGKEVNIININGDTSKGKIWSNGEKDIIEIKLSNKQIIKCTPTHMFMLNNNEECEAQNLLNKRVMRYYGKTNLSNDLFVQLGFLQGDGGVGRIISESHKGLEINIGYNDKEIFDLFNIIPINGKRTYYTNGYNDILIKYGFDGSSLPERVFPITYINWTKEQKLNFLKGCYSANGCVIKTYRVSYKTTSKVFSLQLKKALEEFGITAYITTNKPKMIKFDNGEYLCKESYDINIGKLNDIVFFYQNIGFMQQYKINDLIELIKLKSPKVITIKKLGKQKTYDFSEPLTHWGVVENIIVHNCAEILLDSNGLCNLTTVNVFAFVENSKLNIEELLKAQRLSARSGYRMTCVELELPKWDAVQQRDKLTGCSLTGWQDMVNALSMSKEEEIELLKKLRQFAHEEIHAYSQELGLPESLLITTCKPEGTLSQLPGVTSGVHYSESEWFVRRVRINSHDPLVKVCEELNYPIFPEVGQTIENCTTKVIEFPMKSSGGRTKYDVSAIEQLENYKMFMTYYVDHNASITVTVRDEEWEEVEEWVYNNWDDIVAVSFLSLSNSFYQLMPYESITEEEYNKRVKNMKPFIPSLISKYEKVETEFDIGNDGCESGVCPIR